jgi:hypothetical protein
MTTKPLRSRCGVVLKGTWYFGYGARFDKAQLKICLRVQFTPNRRIGRTSQ